MNQAEGQYVMIFVIDILKSLIIDIKLSNCTIECDIGTYQYYTVPMIVNLHDYGFNPLKKRCGKTWKSYLLIHIFYFTK